MNDCEYQAFAQDCLARVDSRRQETTELFLAQGRHIDAERGIIQFRYGDETMAEADAVVAGSWSQKSNSWRWSWANDSLPAKMRFAATRLKDLATMTGRPQFASEDAFQIECGGPDELAAIACRHLGGIGIWKEPVQEGVWAFFVLLKISYAFPEDRLLPLAENAILGFLLNGNEEGSAWINVLRQRFPAAQVELIGADLRGPTEEWAHDLHIQLLIDSDRIPTNKVRNLSGIDLSHARLDGVILRGVDLRGASLEGASLIDADLSGADLRGASLRNTFLNGANLTRASVEETDLTGAELSRTLLVHVDLSRVKGLDAVHHLTPSEISFSSLVDSKFEIDVKFLRDAGVSKGLIDDLIAGQRFESTHQTCFLSYSSRDREFADRLHASLVDAGIRVFQDRFDFIPGDQLDVQIADAIREHNRLVVVLSPESLKSEWVKREIKFAWDHDPRSLLPIRLCPIEDIKAWTASQPGSPDIGDMISILDFSGWRIQGKYALALSSLCAALLATVKPAANRVAIAKPPSEANQRV
jgi:uncharacterized protein YjbI with pentapeptide repeats